MKETGLLASAISFLRLHRVLVLIICVIIAGSIFSVYMLVREHVMEPTFASSNRRTTRVSIAPTLPPKPLKKWGPDPFKDVIKEMEIARQKAAALAAAKKAEEDRKKAAEDAARKAELEEIRKAQLAEIEKARAEQQLKEKREKEKLRRKKIIQSIHVDGILFNPKGESAAIIQGKPYNIGNTVVKDGVSAILSDIEQNAVVFKDAESGDTYRVPLSR